MADRPKAAQDKVAPATEEPQFCCFGCRFAASIVREQDDTTTSRWTMTRLGLSIFFSMNVMVFTMALWSNDVYGVDGGQFSASLHEMFRYLCLLFSLPVLGMLGLPLWNHAWRGLRSGRLTSELLIVGGVAAAFVFSAASVIRNDEHVYFEVGCMVLVLVTFGRWLEATGRLKATTALNRLERLLPDRVKRVRSGIEEVVPLDELLRGDAVRVRAGERFPADGRIAAGLTTVDEQIFTGESLPQERVRGEQVLGGTVNIDGDVVIELTAGLHEGSFARLLKVLHEARSSRGHYQQTADRVAQWFVPAVAVLALGVLMLHWNHGTMPAVMRALSVVLIACPCALGLATPLAVWTALSQAARHQVVFRDSAALEQLANVRAVRFDKTGTLTDGTPHVAEIIWDPATATELCTYVAATLSGSSTHVYSEAIHSAIVAGQTTNPDIADISDIRTVAGSGIEAQLIDRLNDALTARIGSARFVDIRASQVATEIHNRLTDNSADESAMVLMAWGGRIRGLFLLNEELRPEALMAIENIKRLGLDVGVLSGDRDERAKRLSHDLAIPALGGLSPADKVDCVRSSRQTWGTIAMVGDGINDAPALAASDVGIALGCGADVTRDSATVCVLGNDLRRIPWAIALARRTRRIVRQNLAWAFGYNSVGIVLAAAGFLNPAIAAALMVVSSLMVIVNSLRLSADIDQPGVLLSESTGLQSTGSQRAGQGSRRAHPQTLTAGVSE